MEKPRIRHIEALPFTYEGREVILLRDSEGLTESSLIITRETAFIISLMDGTRTVSDIQTECMRAFGELIYIEQITQIVEAMDSQLFLDNERFHESYRQLRETYERSEVREAFLAGKSYPANRMGLLNFLEETFRNASPDGHVQGEIVGILSPHIDYNRGIEVYRETYPYLKSTDKPLLVILGTCHRMTEKIWSISLKDYSTPLETIPSPKGLTEMIKAHPLLKDYVEEWPHRNEHSIELQLPLIQFMMHHDFEMLPILTGSMHEYVDGARALPNAEITGLVEGLKELLEAYGRPHIIVNGADLAHIGAQFGERFPLSPSILADSKEKDEALLKFVDKVDPDGFFSFVMKEGDRRRICGLTPIYFQLKLLEGSSFKSTGYRQWTDGSSSVSFAGGVFYR